MHVFSHLIGSTIVAVGLAGCATTGDAVPPGNVPQPFQTQTAIEPAAHPVAAAQPVSSMSYAAATAGKSAAKNKYVFPVRASRVSFARKNAHSGYPATDIFTACGKPVVATTSGVVLEVSRVDRYVKGKPDGPRNGGKFVAIKGDDGIRYYGSHLSRVQSGVNRGVRVRAGQVLGKVGHTGNASGVCHLHYGISPPCKTTGDWKIRRGVVWPAKYLTSWRKGGKKSPTSAVKAWNKKHRCKV